MSFARRKRLADAAEHLPKRVKRIEHELGELEDICSAVKNVCGSDTPALAYKDVCSTSADYLLSVANKAHVAARELLTRAAALKTLAAQIPSASIHTLPYDCLASIAESLDLYGRSCLASTCKAFAELICAMDKRKRANIFNAGEEIERGNFVYYAARRYSSIAWTKVHDVLIDCSQIRHCFSKDKWADLQRFIEVHLPRIYPNTRTITLKSRLWTKFSLELSDYRIKIPDAMTLALCPMHGEEYFRTRYANFVDPSSITVVHITDMQDASERQAMLELALYSGRTPNLRELYLNSRHSYLALHNLHTSSQSLREFNTAPTLKVYFEESSFVYPRYETHLMKQLLLHTTELYVKLCGMTVESTDRPTLIGAFHNAIVALKHDRKEYSAPSIYVWWLCSVRVLRVSGALALATAVPVYLVLQPEFIGSIQRLQEYFKKPNLDDAAEEGRTEPALLFFAIAVGTEVKHVPHPYCETIDGALSYHRFGPPPPQAEEPPTSLNQ